VIRCSDECRPACDFCVHYAFNGQPHTLSTGQVAMVYVGKGECKHAEHPGRRCPGNRGNSKWRPSGPVWYNGGGQ